MVVVNYRSSKLIKLHLESLQAPGVRVVLVDNWSDSTERQQVRELVGARGWTLVEMPDNRGFSAGVNAGAAAAFRLGCSCLLLLNPDASVSSETVGALRAQVLAEPRALVSPQLENQGRLVFAGSVLDLADGRTRRAPASGDPAGGSPGSVPWLTAACLAVHRELWEDVNGMDEGYFMYWEDVDLSYRCLRAGGRLVLRTDLVAEHQQGGTQGRRRGRAMSDLYYYYNCRNRLLFGARHLGSRELLRWLAHTPRVSWEILMRGGRRQLVHSPQLALSAAAGATAGVVRAVRALGKP